MRLTPCLLAASLIAGSAVLTLAATAGAQTTPVGAQSGAPGVVAAQTSGSIVRYIVGPMGHVRGFALDNGAIVWLHGTSGDQLAQMVTVGQSVRVDGFAPASEPHVIQRATVYGANGAVLIVPPAAQQPGATTPRMHDPSMRANHMARLAQLPQHTASGTIQIVVPGPRGRIHTLLLSDGSTVFLHGPIAREVNRHGVRVGERVQVTGRGNAYAHGASVLAESVTFQDGTSVSSPLGAPPAAIP